MTHRSRIGVLVIDCQTDDLGPATAFWAAPLGATGAGRATPSRVMERAGPQIDGGHAGAADWEASPR